MEVGDLVRINNWDKTLFPESEGKVGVILEVKVTNIFVLVAKVLAMGGIYEWELDELEVISEVSECR